LGQVPRSRWIEPLETEGEHIARPSRRAYAAREEAAKIAKRQPAGEFLKE